LPFGQDFRIRQEMLTWSPLGRSGWNACRAADSCNLPLLQGANRFTFALAVPAERAVEDPRERRLKISRSYAHQSMADAASHRLATVATW
jgi:hypothetical protein